MARMSVEDVLDKKYVTDSSLAQQLVAGTLTLDEQIIKDHVYQIGAYQEIYGGGDVNNEIHYTATEQITPTDVTVFGATYLPEASTFDETTGEGVLKFDGDVTVIGEGAFSGCSALTSVTIPNSVTGIGEGAFESCSGLTSITIPDSITEIGVVAFIGCTGLTSINVVSDNPNYCSVDGVLFNKAKTFIIQYTAGKQGAYAIPNSVTSIGAGAFYACSGLTSIEIPDSVTSIADDAFSGCIGLTSVEIPDSVAIIGEGAFESCSGLTSATIGNSVASIGEEAFNGCTSLTSVTCEALTPPTCGTNAFADTNDCPIYVPADSVDAYKEAWSAYESRIASAESAEEPVTEPQG